MFIKVLKTCLDLYDLSSQNTFNNLLHCSTKSIRQNKDDWIMEYVRWTRWVCFIFVQNSVQVRFSTRIVRVRSFYIVELCTTIRRELSLIPRHSRCWWSGEQIRTALYYGIDSSCAFLDTFFLNTSKKMITYKHVNMSNLTPSVR